MGYIKKVLTMTKLLAEKARTLSIKDRVEREKQNKLMRVVFDMGDKLATDIEYNRVVNRINRCAKSEYTHCIYDIFISIVEEHAAELSAYFSNDELNNPLDKSALYLRICYQIAFIFAERLRKEGFIVNLDDKENDRVIMIIWWK